jgi:hypothetical protein
MNNQPWDESAQQLVDVFDSSSGSVDNGHDNNNSTSNTYSDPLAQFENDDGNWRSGATMGTFDSTNENSGAIVVIDVDDPEAPLHAATGQGGPTSPPGRRRSSLKEFFEEEEDAARRASAIVDEKTIDIKFDDDAKPLTDDEIQLFRGLLRKERRGRGSDSSSGEHSVMSTRSSDTETREKTVKAKLSPDTFSFLIASPVRSAPFVAGLFILGLKGGIFALIAANLVDTKAENNPLGIPTSVPAPVIVGQFLALFIAVATQGKYIPNN